MYHSKVKKLTKHLHMEKIMLKRKIFLWLFFSWGKRRSLPATQTIYYSSHIQSYDQLQSNMEDQKLLPSFLYAFVEAISFIEVCLVFSVASLGPFTCVRGYLSKFIV